MVDESIVIGIRGDLSGGRPIKQLLDDIAKGGDKATASTKAVTAEMKALQAAANSLTGALKGVIAGFGVREIVRMMDSVAQFEGRLKLATRSAQEFDAAMSGLRAVTRSTGADLETTVSIFQRLSFVRDEIKATVNEMVAFTDVVSKLGVVSGASPDALRAGLLQLGQALSSGILRAEEFNSVMENIPAVGVAIAKQFGVLPGQLRQLVLEGEVLADDIFTAVLKAAKEANEQIEQMPMTFSRAAGVIRAAFQGILVDLDETTGLAGGMLKVADIVTGLGDIFIGAANIGQAAFKVTDRLWPPA